MSQRVRVGVLVSGNGSNLQALIDASAAPDYPARISVVISNSAGAFALRRAQQANIPATVLEHGSFATRDQFEDALLQALVKHEVELLCLAGFMRLLSPRFLRLFNGQVLNIHPALLPSFPGLHAPRQALAHGVKISGCTVHFVDERLDAGPIILQAAVPVLADDTEESLAARILEQEHRIYSNAIRIILSESWRIDGRRVVVW